ncbi:MAG: T9SS type A sorting domain-containing protein [candidate division Zixibacteria bacterium]|nr:T9SS type A sorting domain-containing protein [candidate division Zixibacteria bacterium]
MKKSNWNSIPLIVIFLFVSYSLSVFSADQKIGTCYRYAFDTDVTVDNNYVDTVGITSFRFNGKWGWMDDLAKEEGYDSLADYIASKMPTDASVTKIFMIRFWHDEYMARENGYPEKYTFPVDSDYIDSLKAFCNNLADELDDKGIEHFVLHNEPDLGWASNEGQNWMGTPEQFAEQCYWCGNQILRANPDASLIFGSFAGVDTSYFVRTSVDSILNITAGNFEIDCVDFHCYGDSMPQSTADSIAHRLSRFCDTLRSVDWSIMETRGPNYNEFPVDHGVRGGNAATRNIRDSLVLGLSAAEPYTWTLKMCADSLYAWTEYIDSGFLLIEKNWDDLEDEKVAEFDNRIVSWVDAGAKYVHWFSAYRHTIWEFPTYPGAEKADWDEPGNATDSIDLMIHHAETYPLNIAFEGSLATGLADTIKGLVDELGRRYVDLDLGGQIANSSMVLYPNYPNAFNSETKIDFYLTESASVKLEIYNLLGQKVSALIDRSLDAGYHEITWDASDAPSGVYFYKLSNGEESITRKMCLLK